MLLFESEDEPCLEEEDLLLPPDLPDLELEEDEEPALEEALGVEDLLPPFLPDDDPSDPEEELLSLPEEELKPPKVESEVPLMAPPDVPPPMLVVEPVIPEALTPEIDLSEVELLPALPAELVALEFVLLESLDDPELFFC